MTSGWQLNSRGYGLQRRRWKTKLLCKCRFRRRCGASGRNGQLLCPHRLCSRAWELCPADTHCDTRKEPSAKRGAQQALLRLVSPVPRRHFLAYCPTAKNGKTHVWHVVFHSRFGASGATARMAVCGFGTYSRSLCHWRCLGTTSRPTFNAGWMVLADSRTGPTPSITLAVHAHIARKHAQSFYQHALAPDDIGTIFKAAFGLTVRRIARNLARPHSSHSVLFFCVCVCVCRFAP